MVPSVPGRLTTREPLTSSSFKALSRDPARGTGRANAPYRSCTFFINSADCLRAGQITRTNDAGRNSASRRASAAATVLFPLWREQRSNVRGEGERRIDVCQPSGCIPASARISAGSLRNSVSIWVGAAPALDATSARSLANSARSLGTPHLLDLASERLDLLGQGSLLQRLQQHPGQEADAV